MEEREASVAIISGNPDIRRVAAEVLRGNGGGAWSLGAELTATVAGLTEADVEVLLRSEPNLILVDIDGQEPTRGIAFLRYLAGRIPSSRILVTGPSLASDVLLDLMRVGVAEFLPAPFSEEPFAEGLRRAISRLPVSNKPAKKQGVLYAAFSAKGGSGTTTMVSNLAVVLHKATGRSTLLLDLDAELGEISLHLGMKPRFNFVDLIQNFHRIDAGLLSSYIERHASGVHLLSAPYHPDRAATITEDQIRQILRYLRGEYDYVVVDTSKTFGPQTLAAFEQAEQVILVTNVDLASLRNVQRILPLVKRVVGDPNRIRLVVNRYQETDAITLKDVEETLGIPVFWKLRNDYEALMLSLNKGQPIVLNGKSPYAQDLQALGHKLAGKKPTPAARRSVGERLSGIFRRKAERGERP